MLLFIDEADEDDDVEEEDIEFGGDDAVRVCLIEEDEDALLLLSVSNSG